MSNLLDKASIILTPNAYNNGKALCVKPSDGSGDFDFSRNSAATRVNAQGLVENVQILSSNLVQNGDFSEEGVQEVSNGSFSQEGSELVTNGDFATDSDWTLTQATISNGAATFVTTDGSFAGIRQNVFTIGKTYLISLEVSNLVGTAEVNTNGGTSIGLDITSNGVKSFYMVAENTDIEIKRKFGITNVSATIDNCSVREVGQDWTLGTGWSIAEDKAICDGTQTSDTFLYQNIGSQSNKTIKYSFTVNNYVSGTLKTTYFGATGTVVNSISANGDYVFYVNVQSGHNGNTGFKAEVGFIGSITNISVKEVGQNWNLNGVDFSLGSVFFNSDTDNIFQNGGYFSSGTKYKLTFEGSGNLAYRTGFAGADGTRKQITLPHTAYLTATADTNRIQAYGANGNLEGTLTNISIIEITTDTSLPRINYEGFSYQDALGSEEVVNGTFSSDTAWVKGTGWTISGGNANGLATLDPIRQVISGFTTGKKYKVSFEITEVTNGFIRVYSYVGASGTFTKVLETPSQIGTYEVIFEFGGTNKNLMFYGSIGGGNFTGSIDNVSVKEYLGQSVVPDSGCGSWLWEPQSTNLITYSEDFSQWSSAGDVTVESGYLAPDGTNNAYKISGTTSALTLGGASETSTRTIYARTVSGTGQANLCSFNQNTNNFFTVTEQWQRFEVNGAIAIGGTTFYAVDFRGNTNLTDILIWGAQSEALSYATSYIPTSGSTVTRNQDVCNNGGSLATINSTEGTLYFEGSALVETDTNNRHLSISSGSNNNRLYFYYSQSGRFAFASFVGGVLQANITYDGVVLNNSKVACKYKENDYALWVDGVEVGTDTSASVWSSGTFDRINFSEPNGIGSPFFGKTKCLAVWKEALSDSELQSLTTI